MPSHTTTTPSALQSLTPGFAGVDYPALNSQGLSLARPLRFVPRADWCPHTLTPHASEARDGLSSYVTEGELYVGCVGKTGKLFSLSATLKKGDVWLFLSEVWRTSSSHIGGGHHAVSVSVRNGPGVQLIASALFGSTPEIKDEVGSDQGLPASPPRRCTPSRRRSSQAMRVGSKQLRTGKLEPPCQFCV